jgi:hypothetical protein
MGVNAIPSMSKVPKKAMRTNATVEDFFHPLETSFLTAGSKMALITSAKINGKRTERTAHKNQRVINAMTTHKKILQFAVRPVMNRIKTFEN